MDNSHEMWCVNECVLTVRQLRRNRRSRSSSAADADDDNVDDNDDVNTNLPSIAVAFTHTVDNILPTDCSEPAENHLQQPGIPRQQSPNSTYFLCFSV